MIRRGGNFSSLLADCFKFTLNVPIPRSLHSLSENWKSFALDEKYVFSSSSPVSTVEGYCQHRLYSKSRWKHTLSFVESLIRLVLLELPRPRLSCLLLFPFTLLFRSPKRLCFARAVENARASW
jgi:hypothetical protein